MSVKSEEKNNTSGIDSLFESGTHFGYSKNRRHPSVKDYIYGSKNSVDIFDLQKVSEKLEEAKQVMKELGEKGAMVLFVGTKNEAKGAVKGAAESVDQPYVCNRWVGGTLTNFAEIRGRVNRMLELIDNRDKGELQKYTKKERLDIEREIEKMEVLFGGLRGLTDLPAALVIVDPSHEKTALREAARKGVKVIALAGSDADLNLLDHPVPGNDSNRKSIQHIINELTSAYKEAKPINA